MCMVYIELCCRGRATHPNTITPMRCSRSVSHPPSCVRALCCCLLETFIGEATHVIWLELGKLVLKCCKHGDHDGGEAGGDGR